MSGLNSLEKMTGNSALFQHSKILLKNKKVVSIGLFHSYFLSFSYNGVYFLQFIFNHTLARSVENNSRDFNDVTQNKGEGSLWLCNNSVKNFPD